MPRSKESHLPPNQRSNWYKLNEGQRRYAYEQWMLAKVRRGETIDENHQPGIPEDLQVDPPAEGDIAEGGEEIDEIVREATQDMPAVGKRGPEPSTSSGSSDAGGKKARNDATQPDSTGAHEKGKSKLTGTAKDQGGGAPMEGTPRGFALPPPSLSMHNSLRHYRKIHRFYTYGFAYDALPQYVQSGTENILQSYWLTTPLAEIPWDKPYFYLNPSEFNQLPQGANIVHCSVDIRSRNVRIAFPTNSANSELATLNQNKNIIAAYGLNINVHAVPLRYVSFAAGQPMIPNVVTPATDEDHVNMYRELYGWPLNRDSTQEQMNIVPRHQVGIPVPLRHYAGIYHPVHLNGHEDGGWPCLQHYYREVDADAATGNSIAFHEYTPANGLIKEPVKSVYYGYPFIQPLANNQPLQQHVKIPITSKPVARTIVDIEIGPQITDDGTNLTTNDTAPKSMTQEISKSLIAEHRNFNSTDRKLDFTLTLPIEKSQALQTGTWNAQSAQVQPTVHVGIQPVHALTSKNITGASNNNFTDAQAYIEVIAECVIDTAYPTPFPLHGDVHVTENGATYFHRNELQYYQSTYDGLLHTKQ